MDKCLIISSSDKLTDPLSELLMQAGIRNIEYLDNGGKARRSMIENEYDIIIINAPLKDENGIELSIDISGKTDSGVILLVKAEHADQVQEKVEEYGVFVVAKPISRQLIYGAVKFVAVSRNKVLSVRKKEDELRHRLEDMKWIDRAKCCLIQYLNMTEPQAHRHIEKQAMDMRKSRRAIAEDIIKAYEMRKPFWGE
jgi:response regulator NasT